MRPFQLSRIPAIRFAPGLYADIGRNLAATGVDSGPVLLKIIGQPVWKLLGCRCPSVSAYVLSATLHSPDKMADVAERRAERGFRGMKVRFHRGDWRDCLDEERLAATRMK